jgi:acrylyl-CoA reductase (NADPH)
MQNTTDDWPVDFPGLRTHFLDGKVESRLERLRLQDLSPGELVVRTLYAGVNYKDGLSIHGQAKIITEYPRVAGIELVGEVIASSTDDFRIGQVVLVHGFQTGIAFDGGFSRYCRIPAAHAQALPQGLTPYEAAVIGVPGFTAAMALEHFESCGIQPSAGPIAVSGAGGAVGLLAMGILSRAGYSVAAITRRTEFASSLLSAGATEVIDAAVLDLPQRALEKARFSAAIDNLGGTMLSWLLRSMKDGGCVACVGNASGNTYEGSVLPFIMRRIQLFGVMANAPWPQRRRLWERLGQDLKPDFAKLLPHVKHIRLEQLMAHTELQLKGQTSGRVLVSYED